MLFVKPKYIISVHSFVPYYNDEPLRNYEVGLIHRTKGTLVDKLYDTLTTSGIKCRLNEPYDMNDGFCHAQDSMISWNHPYTPEVLIMNFRNDLCSKSKWRKQVLNIMTPVLEELSNESKNE